MSYPITSTALDLFQQNYRQVLRIEFQGTMESLVITDADIVEGTFAVNRYSVSGEKIEIGSVCAAEVEFTLDNTDHRYDDVTFEGAKMLVKVGVKKWDAHNWENAVLHWIPMGYFTIDTAPRKLEAITISALDGMVKFDREFDPSQFSFPYTVSSLVSQLCTVCGVNLSNDIDFTQYVNTDYSVTAAPDGDGITYRQMLSWCCEIMGVCAFMDWQDELMIKWYSDANPAFTITASNRFSSDLAENEIELGGVDVATNDDYYTGVIPGTYRLAIEGNALIQHDGDQIAINLTDNPACPLYSFTYTPFSATVKPLPYVWPLDMLVFTNKDGGDHDVIVTNVTFKLNVATTLEGRGVTPENDGYATVSPLTAQQRLIIERVRKEAETELAANVQSLLHFNQLISNSMGIYTTDVPDGSGGSFHYLHDNATLASSHAVWRWAADGFAWTDDYQGEQTVWQSGFTADGNAIFNKVTAYGLNVVSSSTGYQTIISPSQFTIKNNNDVVFTAHDGGVKIYNGSIKIYSGSSSVPGTPVFEVDSSGNLHANNIYGTVVGTGLTFIANGGITKVETNTNGSEASFFENGFYFEKRNVYSGSDGTIRQTTHVSLTWLNSPNSSSPDAHYPAVRFYTLRDAESRPYADCSLYVTRNGALYFWNGAQATEIVPGQT